ncbi:hypothetical protein [Candidatus Electronema sp. TJ]|uniref:hypothetical protein n=1 Tax=Candidatus Electronema sp. TJ TaxID=3401573 RepID=UPI003AA90140
MKRKMLPQAAAVLLLLSAGAAQAASVITTIGRHPFHQPPLQSAEDLKAMLREQQDEIREGMDKAGSSQLHKLLEAQFPAAEIREAQYEPGTVFRWMLFKPDGKGEVKAARDLTWAGAKAVAGYEFALIDQDNCLRHTFAVPKGCGNLALLSTERVQNCPPEQAEKKIPEPLAEEQPSPQPLVCPEACVTGLLLEGCPPECLPEPKTQVPCLECLQNCLPACQEHPKDVGCPPYCADCLSQCAPCPEEDCPPITCADCPPECAANPDECPDECAELDCPPPPASWELPPFRFLGDVGYYKQTDPADYIFGRIGAEWSPFAAGSQFEQVSFTGMIGAAAQVKGDDGDDALLLDVMANYNWQAGDVNGWVGLGLGGWITSGDVDDDSGDSDLDLIANVGARVYGDPQAFNISAFLEIRSAVDEFDGLAEYGRFGGGLRFKF